MYALNNDTITDHRDYNIMHNALETGNFQARY